MQGLPRHLSGQTYEVPIYHHGSRIVRATLDRIFRTETLAQPTQLVFASNSNGSRGAYTEVDGWKAWIDALPLIDSPVDVRLYANSLIHDSVDIEACNNDSTCTSVLDAYDHAAGGWDTISGVVSAPGSTDLAVICPATGVASCEKDAEGNTAAEAPADGIAFETLTYQPGGREGEAAQEWGIAMDESCVVAHPGETSACLDPMHVLLYHLETPAYLALSGYDRAMRSGNVTPFTATYEAWSLDDYHQRLVAFTQTLREARPGQKDEVRLPGHGVWIDSTADHKGPTNVEKLTRTLERDAGDTIALIDSLRNWLDATDAHAPWCVSDGKPLANPENPMNTSHGGTPVSAAECF